jgi:hypothetical protein
MFRKSALSLRKLVAPEVAHRLQRSGVSQQLPPEGAFKMRHLCASAIAAAAAAAAASPALAGVAIPLGTPLPFGSGGLIGLVAAVVVAGAFIARRKQ